MRSTILLAFCLLAGGLLSAQQYYLEQYAPYRDGIPSPEQFLGYGIGEYHTRHDLIVAYFKELARTSDRVGYSEYGQTYEGRKLVMLGISAPDQLARMDQLRASHLEAVFSKTAAERNTSLPAVIQLGYNVHGNEPSSAEAAMLTAYTLAASEHPEVLNILQESLVFIDPAINPDGRDRHTQWANANRSEHLVSDPQDAEHNEMWPGGRTNHYWFDLNRDWFLAVHPESRGKLDWYHRWYPNVVTDFHEMGTNSTYFFEPMKTNGSKDPIMPSENYNELNTIFAGPFASALDSLGSLYFTKEVFDGTYPGYGSSYPDLQGGLGLLFEQASSRGHVQDTPMGKLTFSFTIRNQYVSGMTTLKTAVKNKAYLRDYQQRFFASAMQEASKSGFAGYSINEKEDPNRLKEFLELLQRHRIEVRQDKDGSYFVPAKQQHYRMVRNIFETYNEYQDSVFYDASSWAVAHFYHIGFTAEKKLPSSLKPIDASGLPAAKAIQEKARYAYLINWNHSKSAPLLYALQLKGIKTMSAYKSLKVKTAEGERTFGAGTVIIPVHTHDPQPENLHELISSLQQDFPAEVIPVHTGFSMAGIDLGSGYSKPLRTPKVALITGTGVRSSEAGEVWHSLDQRLGMALTRIPIRNLGSVSLEGYNTLIMVSGNYRELDSLKKAKLKEWVGRGNTLISIGTAGEWLIKSKMIKEKLLVSKPDTLKQRLSYIDASEHLGREELGGALLWASMDLSHPLAFGTVKSQVPVYKNNTVYLKPSENPYATPLVYLKDAHLDGYISEANLEKIQTPAASVLVSPVGKGRVILFADDPVFRGTMKGSERWLWNALFHGDHIEVPEE